MYHMLFGTRHHSDQLHYRTSRTLNLRESQIVVRESEEELRHTAITKATAKALLFWTVPQVPSGEIFNCKTYSAKLVARSFSNVLTSAEQACLLKRAFGQPCLR
jgi:hypothetical protein